VISQFISDIGHRPLCNRNAERAPKILGCYFVLCWRCTGLILGGLLGSFLSRGILNQTNNVIFILVLSMPFVTDVFTQRFFFQESNNTRRFLTGILFGVALANFRPF